MQKFFNYFPTVNEMFGEYKICRMWLTMKDFYDLNPHATDEQYSQLNTMFEEFLTRLMK